ncbi:hypothetical protein LENED_006769 [Lentinula edodes]|uniref:Uncharacterized protein n=1 Tax=Lentinula edodes TaxID=5353 RepID=A0A1Q3ECK7_LENED|nr:hypothetical protein LENED_006769 [Lentinula edodes]
MLLINISPELPPYLPQLSSPRRDKVLVVASSVLLSFEQIWFLFFASSCAHGDAEEDLAFDPLTSTYREIRKSFNFGVIENFSLRALLLVVIALGSKIHTANHSDDCYPCNSRSILFKYGYICYVLPDWATNIRSAQKCFTDAD